MFSQCMIAGADPRFVIQVHGGAWAIPASLRAPHIAGVKRAYGAALDALTAGARPLDAVLAALEVMEDDPTFDAGTGSFLNEDGDVELDAAVMEGKDLKAGETARSRARLVIGTELVGETIDRLYQDYLRQSR